MKHIFTSGEEIYGRNKKKLEQDTFTIAHIEYENVTEETLFKAIGAIEDKQVCIEFKIKLDNFGDIKFRNSVKILMQSDLLQTDWEHYTITYL